MRLFLAIELPEVVQQFLDKVRQGLCRRPDLSASVKWVRRENRHLTVKFVGEVEDARVSPIVAALSRTPPVPAGLELDRMVYFPKRGPVHVVGVGVGGEIERLIALNRLLEAACEPLGIPRERRPYLPHVTVGRSRDGEPGDGLGTLRHTTLDSLFPGPTFTVAHVDLMRSHLKPGGPEYEIIQRLG